MADSRRISFNAGAIFDEENSNMFENQWRKQLNEIWSEQLEKSLDLKRDKTIYLVAKEAGKEEINRLLWIGEDRPDARTVTARMISECIEKTLAARDPRSTKIMSLRWMH
jgi:hypothetical protein